MRELRSALQVLRADEPTGHPGPAPWSGPAAAGLAVDLTVTGDERPLPQAVDRAAYRIVQEALTNAARHAGPAKVTVLIDYGRGARGGWRSTWTTTEPPTRPARRRRAPA